MDEEIRYIVLADHAVTPKPKGVAALVPVFSDLEEAAEYASIGGYPMLPFSIRGDVVQTEDTLLWRKFLRKKRGRK